MKRTRMKKTALLIFVLVLITVAIFVIWSLLSGKVLQVFTIQPDGSVDPASAPIQRSGNTYTFTSDAYARIVVQRRNIVIDGAGHTLHGPFNGTKTGLWIIGEGPNQEFPEGTQTWTIGIDLAAESIVGVTIRNLNVKNFTIGTYIWTTNNALIGNAFTENNVGILLSGSGNNMTGNYIANNEEGIFFGVNEPGDIPLNITMSRNCFLNNEVQLSGCVCEEYNQTETPHTWDNGKEGNYWSDYLTKHPNAKETGDTGIGDTPYVIDVLNYDRYPLTRIPVAPPTVAQLIPPEVVVTVAILVTVLVAAAVVFFRKRKLG